MTPDLDLDLEDRSPQLPVRLGDARVLVRRGGSVLGTVVVEPGDRRTGAEVRAAAARYLAPRLVEDDVTVVSAPPVLPASAVSVVVVAAGDERALAACVADLAAAVPPPGEVLVRRVVDGDLAAAREEGWRAATGEVVVFVESDRRVDARFVGAVAAGFVGADVDAVTGVVLPAQLATPAQRALEAHRGAPSFRRSVDRAAAGVRPQRLPAVAVLAVRRSALAGIGGFGNGFRSGLPGRSALDADVLTRVLAAGRAVLHQPDAVVRQLDPRSLGAIAVDLARQASAEAAYLRATGDGSVLPSRAVLRRRRSRLVRRPLLALRSGDRSQVVLALAAAVGDLRR